MLNAVIFDLDGTLIDSEPRWLEAHRRLFAEAGFVYGRSEHQELIGRRIKDALPEFIARHQIALDPEAALKRRKELFEEVMGEKGQMQEKPGAAELVRALVSSRIKVGLASSSGEDYVKKMLGEIGLRDCFPDPVAGEEVANGKPAPDIFLEAARVAKADPERCVVFEDAPVGVEGALAAGMRVVGLLDPRFVDELPGADRVIQDFKVITLDQLHMIINGSRTL